MTHFFKNSDKIFKKIFSKGVKVVLLLFYLSVIESEDDKQLFCNLYADYHDLIYAAALKECENHIEDAEDLMQTTFTKAAVWIDKHHSIPTTTRISGWLLVIMRNTYRDICKTNEEHIEKVPYDYNLFYDGNDFRNDIINKVTAEFLVSKLSDKEKDLLRMKYLGYSTDEMAEALGISSSAVRQRLKRTFSKLHDWYKRGMDNA